MESNQKPSCPKCKQADQVQKVTDVYDENTQVWSEEELGMDVFGHVEDRQIEHEAHTKLGSKLKPPEEPTPPRHPGLWYGIGIGIVILLLAALCPFVVAPLAIVIPIALSNSATLPEVFRTPHGQIAIAIIAAAGFIVGLVVLGLLVFAGFKVKRRYDRDVANYRDRQEAYERDQLRPYQRAKQRWENAYFCRRDAVVFIPSENKAVPVEDLQAYIQDPYYRF